MEPSVLEYIDYRKFLADYYNYKKKTSRYFSYRYFSNKIGLNSPSFLKQVIEGKRNLTPQMIERFCSALNFNQKESRYFRSLVLFNQAKTIGEKQEYYTLLKTFIENVQEAVLCPDQYDYFSTWYLPVIRELVCAYNFKDNYEAIAKMLIPEIQPSEVKKAIELLVKLKLIERSPDGGYCQTHSAVTVESNITSFAIRAFTRKMIELSGEALESFEKNERNISGITMGISNEAYHLILSELEAFKDRIKIIVNRDKKTERVYQLNISFFPLSKSLNFEVDNSEGE
ncbi:MAG: TIGR02147 family protein [Chitinispirillaceae bacterium]|nr:TIGR02147 family protein [Chitinispirillaceae bacterium]